MESCHSAHALKATLYFPREPRCHTNTSDSIKLGASRVVGAILGFVSAAAAFQSGAITSPETLVANIASIAQEGIFADATGSDGRYQVTQVNRCVVKFDTVYQRVYGSRNPPVTIDFTRPVTIDLNSRDTVWVRYKGQGPDGGYLLSVGEHDAVPLARQLIALQSTCRGQDTN